MRDDPKNPGKVRVRKLLENLGIPDFKAREKLLRGRRLDPKGKEEIARWVREVWPKIKHLPAPRLQDGFSVWVSQDQKAMKGRLNTHIFEDMHNKRRKREQEARDGLAGEAGAPVQGAQSDRKSVV